MSFILDALRKSEIERQRQSGPSIAEMPVARQDRRLPIALLAIGLLLAVNAGVLLYFLLRDATAPAAELPLAASLAAPVPAISLPASDTTIAAAAPSSVRESAVATDAVDPADFSTLPPDAPDPTLLPDVPVATAAPRVTYSEGPQPTDLPTAQEVGLPEMTVDLHIYTDDPAKRAVFINGRRYTQGSTTAEGAVVEEITQDGAVLTHRGRRFLLPRL